MQAAQANTLANKNAADQNAIGVSLSCGSVNKGKGSEAGNGVTHTETTLNAGNNLTIRSGRDTTLTGAQATGEQVTMDVGRNLTLTSEQDSDNYDSKQQNASAGGSFTFGSMTGSGSVNLSRDKMHSTYDSVQEQTGLFAGAGGFDITVGEHTQLNGAVIGSTAAADKNRLDTGTLGFSNIENRAEYEVEHQSVGISSGGNIGGQFAGNMANSLLVGVNGSGSDSSTTKSAVSEGTITIRDKDNQKQDVGELSRDVEHANQTLSPIFDKEKEQTRLKEAQLIGEIGTQAMDIARTQGKIEATKAGKAELEKHGVQQPGKDATKEERAAYDKALTETAGYKTAQQKWGTGSAIQQGLQAATAAVQGLAGGDMAKALAGASAPYLAEVIHNMTTSQDGKTVNTEANLMAHAVVGAVVAQISGNSALAGAAGAATAEMAGMIALEVYGKSAGELNENERQTVSALATLAAGLAGGLAGDSTADAVAGAQAGQSTVNNNLLGGNEESQTKFVQEHGKDVLSCADDPSSASCQRGEAVNNAIAGSLATGGVALLPGGAQAMWALGAGANAGMQYASNGEINPVNSVVAGWTNVITIGNGLTGTVIWNAAGGALTNQINGDDPLTGAITTGFGAGLGYGLGNYIVKPITNTAGKWVTGGWDPKFDPNLLKYTEVKGQLGISKDMLPSKIPGAVGNASGSFSSEYSSSEAQNIIEKVKK